MIKLQLFGHNDSDYERPNLDYRCANNRRCIVGPDAKGRCQGTSVCIPQKIDEKWTCMQEDGHSPCEKGPSQDGTCCQVITPCKPILQHRKMRKRISVIFLIALAGVLLLISGKEHTTFFITPGPLNAHHQSQSQTCNTCHDINAESPASWWHNSMQTKTNLSKNTHCTQCHNMGMHSEKSHGLSINELNVLTGKRSLPENSIAEILRPKLTNDTNFACVDCHKEHQGDIQGNILSNEQCQTCHVAYIDSFSRTHPDFTQYPSVRRTRINFNHTKHFNKHFMGKKSKLSPSNCVACHQLEERENYMITKDFVAACGGCHVDQISKRKIAFFTLPKIDTKSLSEKNQSIGEWYKRAKGTLTPITELLLNSDLQARKLLIDLSTINISKLKNEELVTHKKVSQLIWKIKSLLVDITSKKGNANLALRLENIYGEAFSKEDRRLLNSIPLDLLKNELQLWLPNLEDELAAKVSSLQPVGSSEAGAFTNIAVKDQWTRSGSWYTKNSSLYYSSNTHGDTFIKLLFRLSQNNNSEAGNKLFESLSHQKKGVGACAKCHSIDEDKKTNSKQINWMGYRNNPNTKSFTRFNHVLHFSMAIDEGCDTCHKLNTAANYSAAFKKGQMSEKIFQSNFKTINRNDCSVCHQESRVGEDCASCHNYHVGEFFNILPKTEFNMKD